MIKKYLVVVIFMLLMVGKVFSDAEIKNAPVHKLRIAVLDIKPKAADSTEAIGDVLEEMLITGLVNTKKFVVLERKYINKILKEQNLAINGYVTPESAAKVGKLLGARYVVFGAITEFTRFSSGGGIAVGPVIVGGKSAKLAIDIRIVDTTTGQIVFAKSETGTSSAFGAGAGGYVNNVFVAGGFASNDPMGKAARVALNKIIKDILKITKDVKWEAKVIKFDKDTNRVYINAGKESGVKVGDIFYIYSKGEALTDPDTGEVLDYETKKVAKVKVVLVKDKYCIAEVDYSYVDDLNINRGDLAKQH